MKKQTISEEFQRMQKLAGIKIITENLKDIQNELEDAGFSFDDGLLGGVGSGGGGYYDYISDKINGYNIDKFDEKEFDNWYDNFSKTDFNDGVWNASEMENYEIDIEKIKKLGAGIYTVGGDKGGLAEITDTGDVILYAEPILSNDDGDVFKPIFTMDEKGNIINKISKEELKNYLIQNIEKPGAWSII